MKKILSILTLCMGLCCVSCYDDSALVERIDALEQSTIASLKASISSLESQSGDIKSSIASLEQSGNANATEIAALKTSLGAIEAKIEELKSWVEKLLEGYYTKEEIDAQIQSLNTEIETLRTKISSIESKLDILMREFVISFDDTEIGILAGGTTSVGYTITGATEKTTVKALGQNGWSAKVTPDGTDKGKITVTAPNPLTEDEIIVLVYDGEFRTIMSSINFVTGVVTPSQTAVELEAEAGTIDITVTSNLNYTVYIPEDAKDWLSIMETKSTKEDIISFKYNYNEGLRRKTTIDINTIDGSNLTEIIFIQKGSSNEVFVEEAGTLYDILNSEELLDVEKLGIVGYLNDTDWLVLKELQNLKYLDLSGVQSTSILKGLFKGNAKIKSLILPPNITEIPTSLCEDCSGLESIIIPQHVQIIGEKAYSGTSKIKGDLIIPNSVIEIRDNAFSYSQNETEQSQRGELLLGKSVKSIGNGAFSNCGYKGTLNIPASVSIIGTGVFARCSNFTNLELSPNIKVISENAFFCCIGLTGELIIPEGVEIIDSYAFQTCQKITKIAFPSTLKELRGKGNFQWNDSLSEIIIPKGITVIPQEAFAGCPSVTGELIIPDNIIEIGGGAFSGTNITSVTLGTNVQSLGAYFNLTSPFAQCPKLTRYYCKNITPPKCAGALSGTTYLGVLEEALDNYMQAEYWKDFDIIEAVTFSK